MLGSVHDAEDALQETMLRAWRGLAPVRGAQLAALVALHDRDQHMPERDRAAAQARAADRLWAGHATRTSRRATRSSSRSGWSPIPDETLGLEDGYAGPEASYERRESVELAFIAALQHLPPNQRAVLILREVLGFSAKEVAETVDTTVASVNSALQRARAAVDERVGERSQQETLRSLGDDGIRELVTRYVDAWERNDVEAFAAMLTEDATFAMPPLSSWYRGLRGDRRLGQAGWPLSGAWRWRTIQTTANGQLALGFYAWSDEDERYRPFALNVLTLRGDRVSDVTAFIARSAAPATARCSSAIPTSRSTRTRRWRCSSASGCPSSRRTGRTPRAVSRSGALRRRIDSRH